MPEKQRTKLWLAAATIVAVLSVLLAVTAQVNEVGEPQPQSTNPDAYEWTWLLTWRCVRVCVCVGTCMCGCMAAP